MPGFTMSCCSHTALARASALLIALTLTACGNKSASPTATQVAAKVGKSEVSVHQINLLLSRQGAIAPEMQNQAKQQILEHLISQELVLQKAQELKVDREPAIMQAIEAAKRDALANAYLARIATSVAKPSPEEVKQYYTSHPTLFAQRRIVDVQEVDVRASAEQLTKIEAKLKTVKSTDELLAALRAGDLPAQTRQTSLAPEAVPPALMEQLTALPAGKPLLLNAQGGMKALVVIASRAAPIDEASATPRIENVLLNERKNKAVEQELKALRAKTNIEYKTPFDPQGSASGANPPVAPSASATAVTPPASGADDDAVSRGLK